jgi:V/A-type H+-transporting ATPase subunit F
MEIVVIGDEDTRTGFKLAGVTQTYPGEEIKAHLTEMLQDDSIGIIMINERYAEENREVLNRAGKDKKRLTPVIVEIPDSKGPITRETDPLQELIRRALGAQIAEEE